MSPSELTNRRILGFWLPLASTWLMMSVEGPFLMAVIARLQNPTENLAAYGIAFVLALVIESPVIQFLSSSTALVSNRDTYFAMRALRLPRQRPANPGVSGHLAAACVPPPGVGAAEASR